MIEARLSYLATLPIAPDSIPGAALLRGDWDASLGMKKHVDALEAERLSQHTQGRG